MFVCFFFLILLSVHPNIMMYQNKEFVHQVGKKDYHDVRCFAQYTIPWKMNSSDTCYIAVRRVGPMGH